MYNLMLKAKLHRARVTQVDPHYEGSCAIDENLLNQAGILAYEQIHIYNITNGHRWVTYAISSSSHSGEILVNGAAARLALPGDIIIICAYTWMPAEESRQFKPVIIRLDEHNCPTHEITS